MSHNNLQQKQQQKRPPTKLSRFLHSGRLPRNDIRPQELESVKQLAVQSDFLLKLQRLVGRADKPDSVIVHFTKNGWTVAAWWEINGKLRIGPKLLRAPNLSKAWQLVLANT